MPRYFYTAKSFKGEEKQGVLEAKDIHQLSQKLREKGFVLIKAKTGRLKKQGFEISLPFGKVPLTEKMFFLRNLRVMTSAGLPLPEAIGDLANQTKNHKLRTALLDIRQEITGGKSLSESLARHPIIFPELFQNMIKVGEESGTLERVLETLNLQMEKEHSLRSKLTGALIYPAVIICTMIGIGILMLVMVIPNLAITFKELNIELPATTKMIIELGNFLNQKWYLVIVIFFLSIIAFRQALKVKEIKKLVDKALLRIPIISPIIRGTNSAYALRTLSSLIAAGIPLPRSLEITSGTLGNFYFKTALAEAAKRVRKGEKLSEALKDYEGVYPSIVIQMIAVGEQTGKTSDVLVNLADFFEEEVSNVTKNLTSVVEPILMLVIGAAVGFFAISMIQPMYSMLEGIE